MLSELEIVSERVQEELGDINGKLAMLTRDRAQAHISKSVAALIHMGLGDGNEHVSCTNARPSVTEQQSEDTAIQRKSPRRVMFQLPEEAERQRAPKEAETHHQHWVSLDSDGDEDE